MSAKISGKDVKLKRAYESPTVSDGTRVLVDRLWPRGVRKTDAAIGYRVKELAPSTELRKWFAHDPSRWAEFRQRYAEEIKEHREEFDRLRDLALKGPITLVYAAHDETHNDAVVLRELLLAHR
ncbi:DUF488 domain-containing protein [Ensifer aridi]|uniref:DUF488 domain-containing protein n=1 Tax=Ensifer aridi TaxID=1708715 RepID=UPI000A105991|nr:DUF488 family protein [Ensifer aridi]